jgi:hypothetical protein
MIQNSKVLAGEANPISLVSTGRTAMQEEYVSIAERRIPVSMSEQSWTFEVAQKAPTNRMTPGQVNPLVRIAKWLNHLGNGRISESYLESRSTVPTNFRIGGIGS